MLSLLFIAFILLCGLTHLFALLGEVTRANLVILIALCFRGEQEQSPVTQNRPLSQISPVVVAGVKWATAVVSAATAVALCWLIPVRARMHV